MPEHLAQGSSEPPLIEGKMRLYGMRFCPFDHRVHLVLLAKNIPHENVWINLKNKPDWFLKRVSSGKVPGLVVDENVLYESLIIADFLDEKFPQRPLHSKDPLQKAKDRILIEGFGKVNGLFYNFMLNGASPEVFESFVAELVLLDQELAQRGTIYFAGKEPGMVDYMIWPFFEHFEVASIIHGSQFQLPEDKLSHLVAWMKAMHNDAVVKEYQLRPEVYVEYIKGHLTGSVNYNIPI